MEGFDSHPGTSRLAAILCSRMRQENDSPLLLDFGEIQKDGSLKTNTFGMPIPNGGYSICRHLIGLAFQVSGGNHGGHTGGDGTHQHTAVLPAVKPGDRVLVAWVQNEAVIVDVVGSE